MIPEASYILGSYALMAYLGAEPGWKRVKETFFQAEEGTLSIQFCMINFGEVLYMTERRCGLEKAQDVQTLIENLPIEIIDATREIVLDAAHIKRIRRFLMRMLSWSLWRNEKTASY